jgi:hypothetical protein
MPPKNGRCTGGSSAPQRTTRADRECDPASNIASSIHGESIDLQLKRRVQRET